MGWALRSGDHVSNPTLEVHPHDPSREFRLAFRTVNLKVAHLAHIGTIPNSRPENQLKRLQLLSLLGIHAWRNRGETRSLPRNLTRSYPDLRTHVHHRTDRQY